MTTDIEFPDCVLEVLAARLRTLPGVNEVVIRPLDPTDGNGTIGLTAVGWEPVEYEIGGHGPTLSEYSVVIEHLVKHSDRVEGNRLHRSVARSVRMMLYRDTDTQVALRQIVHQTPDSRERMMKWSLFQRFASNEINRSFFFVSATTMNFQTELV